MAGKQQTIAFVWDFDKTLIPEYMEDPLFQYFKVDGKKFWNEVNHLPEYYKAQGVEHISKDALYLNHILTYVQKGIFKGLNNALLHKLGKQISFNQGMPTFLSDIKTYIEKNSLYQQYNIKVEHYIVSTGLKEMARGSKVAPFVEKIWANEFIEDVPQPNYLDPKGKVKKTKVLSQLAYVVDNTTKVRALFEINKGTNKIDDGDVNMLLPEAERRIPFANMVYIADRPSDIPCYSVINKYGGKSFVVYKPGSQINFMQALELFKQKRVHMLGEANFEKGSQTYLSLFSAADDIAKDIIQSVDPETASILKQTKKFGHIYHDMKTWKRYVQEKLKTTRLVTFATISESISWSSPVFFALDKELNIYVLLDTAAQHMKNIIFLPKASISLDAQGDDYGIQLVGDVTTFSPKDISNIQPIYGTLYGLHTGDVEFINHASNIDWRIIKISPSRVFLTNPTNPSEKEEISLFSDIKSFFLN